MNALEQLEAKERAATESAKRDFEKMAIRIAKGEEPSAGEIEKVLKAAGRSVADLRKAASSRQHRARLAREAAKLPAVEDKIALLNARVAAQEQRRKEVMQATEDELRKLIFKRVDLVREMESAMSAKLDLFREAPEIQGVLARIEIDQRALARRSAEIDDAIYRLVGTETMLSNTLQHGGMTKAQEEPIVAKLAEVRERIAALKAEIPALHAEGEKLNEQAAAAVADFIEENA